MDSVENQQESARGQQEPTHGQPDLASGVQELQRQPRRLSEIHQYHNAPEVLPEHGLEIDENVYPVSDKYFVTSMDDYPSSYIIKTRENKPPRIIFGMTIRTFLLVSLLFILIVIGAVVGGIVGGRHDAATATSSESSPTPTPKPASVQTFVATSTRGTSTQAISTPTTRPLSDCPSSNGTSYTSNYANGNSGTIAPNTGLNFTKYCDVASPLKSTAMASETITSAFVYTFDDCIELCAGYNFYGRDGNCTVAVYDSRGARPANCEVGRANATSYKNLTFGDGIAVALLKI